MTQTPTPRQVLLRAFLFLVADTFRLPPQGPSPRREDSRSDEYAFIYDEAVRKIAAQRSDLAELRKRTGVILSAAAISTAFFGGSVLEQEALTLRATVAIACFVLSAGAVLLVLLPRGDWKFDFGADTLIHSYVEGSDRVRLQKLHRELALRHEENWKHNEKLMAELHRRFLGAIVFLVLEILAWVANLGV